MSSRVTAAILRDSEWQTSALTERKFWRVQLNIGPTRRRICSTFAEAVEWCNAQGVPYVVGGRTRPRDEWIARPAD